MKTIKLSIRKTSSQGENEAENYAKTSVRLSRLINENSKQTEMNFKKTFRALMGKDINVRNLSPKEKEIYNKVKDSNTDKASRKVSEEEKILKQAENFQRIVKADIGTKKMKEKHDFVNRSQILTEEEIPVNYKINEKIEKKRNLSRIRDYHSNDKVVGDNLYNSRDRSEGKVLKLKKTPMHLKLYETTLQNHSFIETLNMPDSHPSYNKHKTQILMETKPRKLSKSPLHRKLYESTLLNHSFIREKIKVPETHPSWNKI